MAGPITHIVLTEKIFKKELMNFNVEDFIVGTSFPDIRYLGTISREKTHLDITKIGELEGNNSFSAGMKFHSLVDKIRENFVLSRNIYSYCPKSEYITQALKFAEDKMLYEKIADWTNYQKCFDNILPKELESGAGEETISRWHSFLKKYISKKPDRESIYTFIVDINLPENVATEMQNNLVAIVNKPEINSYIEDLYCSFEDLLQNYR